jgi:nicotinamide phosphoribosyltransferase
MNLLLCTDTYKFGHLYQYPKGITKVYSYLQTRTNKGRMSEVVFFGLQYYIKQYLQAPITKENVDEFVATVEHILGPGAVKREHYDKLVELGYLPLKIRAVPEGTIVPIKNVLMTVENTHPDFYWLVGFLESLLLKVWNTCTVASNSYRIKKAVTQFAEETCDDSSHAKFQVHDFGYRGTSSEETAALSGAAHLTSFLGTDTVPAVSMIQKYYKGEWPIGLSVPASEHSVMSSYTKENELAAFKNMLELYPKGIVSIVSDTYDFWNVMINFTEELRLQIESRDGKVVFRPDSGNPPDIICGDLGAVEGSPERIGALEILWQKFGGTTNSKGYRVLNPKVGLIYGDGIYFDRMIEILSRMKEMKFATSNIVFGIGGLLLQNFNRDDLGFAIKATYVEVGEERRSIVKFPMTDKGKKSHSGKVALRKNISGFYTVDNLTDDSDSFLEDVFLDGKLVRETSFQEVRARIGDELKL